MNNGRYGDFFSGLKSWKIWGFLGLEDIKQRYIRTYLGPWWLVIGTFVWVLSMGIVMSSLFNQPIKSYLPFVASGMIMWSFVVGVISDSCTVFIQSENIIKSIKLPIIIHPLRYVTKHFFIFLHNLPVLLLMCLVLGVKFNLYSLLIFPALAILMINACWISLVFGMLNSRYRDTQHIVLTSLSILPFITPIYWDKSFLRDRHWIGDINPFYHAVEIFRASLLGHAPNVTSWIVMLTIAIFGSLFMMMMYRKYSNRVIFWL